MSDKLLEILFDRINAIFKLPVELITDSKPLIYEELITISIKNDIYGLAINLQNIGRSALTMDIFTTDRRDIKQRIKKRIQETTSIRYTTSYISRGVFINIEGIKNGHALGQSEVFIKREVPWWMQYPLSVNAVIALVITHEMTHHQRDLQNDKCRHCFTCSHCKDFYKDLWNNWERVINDEHLPF